MHSVQAGNLKAMLLVTGIAVAIAATAIPARAVLGEKAASIEADRAHMQGTRRISATEFYTVHEIQASTGTAVREYVSADGTVFAVAWQGPWMPDLRQLLGNYFDPYARAAQSQSNFRMGRHPLKVEQPGLVVQQAGQSRAFAGRAYIPEMLPAGVRAEAIR